MLSPSELGDRSGPGSNAFAIIEQRPDERTAVISIAGELDLSTAPQLKWRLVDALEAGLGGIVVDLREGTVLGSTTLRVLVGVRRGLGLRAPVAVLLTPARGLYN